MANNVEVNEDDVRNLLDLGVRLAQQKSLAGLIQHNEQVGLYALAAAKSRTLEGVNREIEAIFAQMTPELKTACGAALRGFEVKNIPNS